MTTPTLSPTAKAVWGIEGGDIDNLVRLRDFQPSEEPNADPETFAAQCKMLAAHLLELPNLKDFYTSNATAASHLAMTQAKVVELEQRAEGAEEEVIHLRARITSLDNDLGRTQRSLDLIQNIAEKPATAGATDRRSVKIPNPPAFSKGREEYRAFKDKLAHKLTGDAHLFRDDQHKLTYAVGYVAGEAYETIRSLLPGIQTVAQLVSYLDSTYEDSDPKGTAERELKALRQNSTTDFSAHFAKFQGIMAVLGWDGAARQAALYNSLSLDLKETLSRTLTPPDETFEQFVATVKSLDDKARRFASEKGNSKAPAKSQPRHSSGYSSNPADSTGTTPHKGPAPMDLSAQKRLEAKQAQYAEWSSKGVCTKCGDPKHWRKECPLNQSRHKLSAAATSSDPAPAISPDSPAPSQAGKE
jgi:hypothetical protein